MSEKPFKTDIITAGEPLIIQWPLTNQADGTPFDISALPAKMDLRDPDGHLAGSWNDSSLEVVRSSVDGVESVVTLTIPASSTITYTFKKAYIDLWLNDGSVDGIRSGLLELVNRRGSTRP